ncbi:hypothetical protein ABZ354_24345 [Streptomyces sp. NPDC005925]|uniref:hypothetical protein n=1 Tax=Streptomyces sp. NPDC005925 TaxID=3157172 RepID=UPI0033E94B01
MVGEALLGILIAAVVAECCGILEWAARVLIGWAARFSYGQAPRSHTRLVEHLQNLDRCPGQITKLLYALGLVAEGLFAWLCRVSGRSGPPGWESAPPSQFFGAVMSLSTALQGFGGDIRAQPPVRRKEFARLTTRLRGLLRHPSEVFDDDGAAALLVTTGSVCDALIDDRNERAALALVEVARPHLERLGSHPAAFGLRRAHASALLQLGCHRRAEELLHGLIEEEKAAFGVEDPRTLRTRHLLYWAWNAAGRHHEAEAGLRALESSLSSVPGTDTPFLRHVQCKRWWTVAEQRRTRAAADGYDRVTVDRSRELRPDHPDTLDARHSKGKMLVYAGDGHQAHAVLRPALQDLRRVEGARHPNTLETRKYLALARVLIRPDCSRTHRRTLRELRRTLRRQTRKHGPDHPHTRDTQQWLALLTRSSEAS